MVAFPTEDWRSAAQLYAFLGNSLLEPMNRTADVGLEPDFWVSISKMFNGALEAEALSLAEWAGGHVQDSREGLVQRVSVEFTHLFVGPPKPAAAPWESVNGDVESHVGFGQATYEMRGILRDMGLSVQNETNQYEDHMGIELLVASEMCQRIAEAGTGECVRTASRGTASIDAGADSQNGEFPIETGMVDSSRFAEFVREHPLSWVAKFQSRVAEQAPGGYFARVVALAGTMLSWHISQVS